jgi:hypothetical protein
MKTQWKSTSWVHLDGTENRIRQLRAGLTKSPVTDGKVLIIGKSTSPTSQQEFAGQILGAVTVEAVDLKDLVQFARDLGRVDEFSTDDVFGIPEVNQT